MEAVVDDSGGLSEGGPTPVQGGTLEQTRADYLTVKPDSDVKSVAVTDKNDCENISTGKDGENDERSVLMMSENAKNSMGKCGEMESSDCGTVNGKRKRNRRKQKGGGRHHRKWKPYDKLTWDERKTLEERETKRACKKRETRFASGQAMAPYNTTQFLMEQHEPSESEFHLEDHPHRHHEHRKGDSRISQERSLSHRPNDSDAFSGNMSFSGGSGDGSSDGSYDSNDEEIFLEKDFTEAYEQYQSEKLESMTKEELVREHLQLEEEVESLKKQLKDSENRRRSSGSSQGVPADIRPNDVGAIQVLELLKQVKRLKEENGSLKLENERLVSNPDVDGAPKTMDVAT